MARLKEYTSASSASSAATPGTKAAMTRCRRFYERNVHRVSRLCKESSRSRQSLWRESRSPHIDANCDPSTPLGVASEGFYTVSIPSGLRSAAAENLLAMTLYILIVITIHSSSVAEMDA
jgi:hypothetical protein